MISTLGQAYQTIAPAWVARGLLIAAVEGNTARAIIGDRCWTTDLPETNEFQNDRPACVVSAVNGDPDPRANTVLIEGFLSLRIFGGSNRLYDCWRAWHAIRQRLITARGEEITITELDFRARWLWAIDSGVPMEVRKHPATKWPELNCTLQFAVQGIQKET